MTAYVALLRAVNVGGTGKLPMSELKRIAEELGLGSPRTFIASGNLVFTSDWSESKVQEELEKALADHMAKPVAVMVRTAAELGVPAVSCLVLEDSLNGVIAAKAARMTCVAIPPGSPVDRRFALADAVVGTLLDVTHDLIERLDSAL